VLEKIPEEAMADEDCKLKLKLGDLPEITILQLTYQ